ncbi:MAG TPA: FAD-dependent oxidoreductase [Thermoplasmata archaeon]|nr:FAD-dependent oxidoreductase [Thermoplasmata archaeon]
MAVAGMPLGGAPPRQAVTERFDVMVLGGGLFGSSLAYYLVREAGLRTLLVDLAPDPERPSATATSAGILSVQGWDPWDLALVEESAEEYGRISEEEGEPGLHRNGGLRVARTDEGVRWLERVRRVLGEQHVESIAVNAARARELLPWADLDDVRQGLFTPDDSVVCTTGLQAAFRRAAARAGADVRQLSQPAAMEARDGGTWALGEPVSVEAERAVVACGASTQRMLSAIGHPLPLVPFRAQAVRLRPQPLREAFPTLHDLDLNLYLRPEPLGRWLAGDGTGTRPEDPGVWRASADPEFVRRMTRSVTELHDGVGSVRVEAAWSGLCVASPDRFPLVGRVPQAPGLHVASGFNGLGTMRSAALARRMADALRTGGWERLRPADPARFAGPIAPFDPRPQFPLEAGPDVPLPEDAGPRARGPSWPAGPPRAEEPSRVLRRIEEVDGLRWSSLSDWFDPFLGLFARDAIRTGGRAEVVEEDGLVRGLLLVGSSEGIGSGFTRERRIAQRYLEPTESAGVYLELPWRPGGRIVEVFAADLRDWQPTQPPHHPVRIAGRDDLPRIGTLMRAELGRGVDPWLATLPRPEETAFICESQGSIVGVSWLSRVGRFARGHSFVVHPRYRGLGIGTDLLNARMLWLSQTGGRSVVSEIYDRNLASRTAAERAGMALVGRMYHFQSRRPDPRRARFEAPHTGGRPSPSSP